MMCGEGANGAALQQPHPAAPHGSLVQCTTCVWMAQESGRVGKQRVWWGRAGTRGSHCPFAAGHTTTGGRHVVVVCVCGCGKPVAAALLLPPMANTHHWHHLPPHTVCHASWILPHLPHSPTPHAPHGAAVVTYPHLGWGAWVIGGGCLGTLGLGLGDGWRGIASGMARCRGGQGMRDGERGSEGGREGARVRREGGVRG